MTINSYKYGYRIFIVLTCLFSLLNACASTNVFSKFSSGKLKNSLPLFDKDNIEETHSVSIPPFFNDNDNWSGLTQEILSSTKISIVPSEMTANALKAGGNNLDILSPEERAVYLISMTKSLEADAVLNGLIITNDNNSELVLQLLSSKDSRVIWWQAVDFSAKQGAVVQTEQKALLAQMLSPVLQHIGKKEKPVVIPVQPLQPTIETRPKIEIRPVKPAEPQLKTDIKPKPKKKQEKDQKSPAPADNISPM
jgi:hypothetical protein